MHLSTGAGVAGESLAFGFEVNSVHGDSRGDVGVVLLALERADVLGQKLGCFLFQFPPSYRYTPSRLKSIVSQLNPAFRNVVEFRHKSWWRAAVYRAFEKRGLIFCSVSAPRLPATLVKTSDVLYVRFHGPTRWYRHDYSREELTSWVQQIRASGAREVWAYFNNDRDAFAIKNAKTLLRLLSSNKCNSAQPTRWPN